MVDLQGLTERQLEDWGEIENTLKTLVFGEGLNVVVAAKRLIKLAEEAAFRAVPKANVDYGLVQGRIPKGVYMGCKFSANAARSTWAFSEALQGDIDLVERRKKIEKADGTAIPVAGVLDPSTSTVFRVSVLDTLALPAVRLTTAPQAGTMLNG